MINDRSILRIQTLYNLHPSGDLRYCVMMKIMRRHHQVAIALGDARQTCASLMATMSIMRWLKTAGILSTYPPCASVATPYTLAFVTDPA